MKKIILFILLLVNTILANAQIGYQVSLLNSATGEPRANETVNCTVTLSGQKSTIFRGTQKVTSNEFGVLSLIVGDANTFTNINWADELPLYIEVTIDGKTIGRSQILNVPVAEHAKHYGTLTAKKLASIPIILYNTYAHDQLEIINENTAAYTSIDPTTGEVEYKATLNYTIVDNIVLFDSAPQTFAIIGFYISKKNILYCLNVSVWSLDIWKMNGNNPYIK